MNSNDTLYQQIVKKLKNNKAVVIVILIFVIVISTSQFIGGLSGIASFLFPYKYQLKADVSIQPYDFMAGKTDSTIDIELISGDIDNIDNVVDQISEGIASAIQAEGILETTLVISGNNLQADRSLIALIHHREPSNARFQISPDKQEMIEGRGFNFETYFQGEYSYRLDCNCIDISIKDRAGSFKPEFINIYAGGEGFSFDKDNLIKSKKLNPEPTETKVIIEPFKVGGASSEIVDRLKNSFDSMLKRKLKEQHKFLKISGMTRQDLLREREEIRGVPPGASKNNLIAQYKVDYIVTGNLGIIKNKSFLGQ